MVLIHGLWGKYMSDSSSMTTLAHPLLSLGNPKHLEVAREELEFAYERALEQEIEGAERHIPELRILVAQGNEGTYTYDGIDVCANRVAKEIDKEVARIEKDGSRVVREFSVMGYSVGGRECSLISAPDEYSADVCLFLSYCTVFDRSLAFARSLLLCKAPTSQFHDTRQSTCRDCQVPWKVLAVGSRTMGLQLAGEDG